MVNKTELEKYRESIGCNVSVDRVIEIMAATSIPGNLVEVTPEEAMACDAIPVTWEEFVAEFGENLDQLPPYVRDGYENVEMAFYNQENK